MAELVCYVGEKERVGKGTGKPVKYCILANANAECTGVQILNMELECGLC
jgi:hypothetical protein